MGIFRKKVLHDYSAPSMKDTMKMLGVVPGSEAARKAYGWTKQDDIESHEVALIKKKRQLDDLRASGAPPTEIMALEISIKGTETWLKENKQT